MVTRIGVGMLSVAQGARKLLGVIFTLSGTLVILFGLFADALGYGGMPGLGPRQIVLTWFGCYLTVTGIFFLNKTGNRFISEIISSPREEIQISIFTIPIWYGLLTGLVEVVIFGWRKAVYAQYLGKSLHLAWVIPLAEVIFFLLIGFALYLLSYVWNRIRLFEVYVGVFSFISTTSILLLFPLHIFAILILAIGVASQTARFAAQQPLWYRWLVSRTISWVGAIAITLMVGMVLMNP